MQNHLDDESLAQYQALDQSVGWAHLPGWSQIDISGHDRASFLHNFCTNDIKCLTPGRGCEAFVTGSQGKCLGFVSVYCRAASLSITTTAGQAETLIPHLDRYIIREDVQLADRTATGSQFLVAGPDANQLLEQIFQAVPPTGSMSCIDSQLSGADVLIGRSSILGTESFLLIIEETNIEEIGRQLTRVGATHCSEAIVDMRRVEAGTPLYGIDITDKNLPQEVGRNESAISFTKGCYLGQETVARIDALGHVNRKLAALKFHGQRVPARGTDLLVGDKVVGHVTSATFSPKLAAPLALAYVRREHSQAGAKLDSAFGQTEVTIVPL